MNFNLKNSFLVILMNCAMVSPLIAMDELPFANVPTAEAAGARPSSPEPNFRDMNRSQMAQFLDVRDGWDNLSVAEQRAYQMRQAQLNILENRQQTQGSGMLAGSRMAYPTELPTPPSAKSDPASGTNMNVPGGSLIGEIQKRTGSAPVPPATAPVPKVDTPKVPKKTDGIVHYLRNNKLKVVDTCIALALTADVLYAYKKTTSEEMNNATSIQKMKIVANKTLTVRMIRSALSFVPRRK